MRVQKLREEAVEKERDGHFNTIRPMFPTKQEWRVKEKVSIPALMASDNDMDLLDDDESPLIKGRSPPPTDMGHQHDVHTTGRVQGCRGGGRSDVSRPSGGRVREA
jgi:hypothetical protein